MVCIPGGFCRYEKAKLFFCVQIVCVTPPAPRLADSDQVLVVAIDYIDQNVVAVCNTDCSFYYRSHYTPYLTTLSLGSVMGRPFDLYGLLHGQTAVCFLAFLSP